MKVLSKGVGLCLILGICISDVQTTEAAVTTWAFDDSGTSTQTITINSAIFTTSNINSGSGTFTRMFAVDEQQTDPNNPLPSGSAQAYNDDVKNNFPFNQKTGAGFTPALTLGQLPVVTINGTKYLQFAAAYNGGSSVSLSQFKVWMSHTAGTNITLYSQITSNALGTKVYDLGSNQIDASGYSSGNGTANMFYNIPLANFAGWSLSDSVYVFARFDNITGGGYDAIAYDPNGTPLGSAPEAHTIWGGLLMGCFLIGGMLKRRLQKPIAVE